MEELKMKDMRTIKAEMKELKTTEAEAVRELKTIKEDITAINSLRQKQEQRGMQKVKKLEGIKGSGVQLKGSEQTRETKELRRARETEKDHGSERSMGRQHTKGSEGMVTVAAACEAGTAGARIGAEVEKAIQAWDTTIAAMGRLDSPVIVASAAATAMQLTAKTWDFKTPDAVEAVMFAARCEFAALRRQWAVATSSSVTEFCSRV